MQHKDRNRHGNFKMQRKGSRDRDGSEGRIQNDTENAREDTQDWLDIEEIEDKEAEELTQTVTEARSGEEDVYDAEMQRTLHVAHSAVVVCSTILMEFNIGDLH